MTLEGKLREVREHLRVGMADAGTSSLPWLKMKQALAALPDPGEVACYISTGEALLKMADIMRERDELAAEILKFQSRCTACGRLCLDHQPCEQCRAAIKRIEDPK
jgi:hypothetical protein